MIDAARERLEKGCSRSVSRAHDDKVLYELDNTLPKKDRKGPKQPTDVHIVDLGGDQLRPWMLSADELKLLIVVYQGANVASAHFADERTYCMPCDDVLPAADLS